MSFFGLDPRADQNLLDQARSSPINPDDLKPGWFAGTWKAPVTGLASTLNDAALLLGDAATPFARSMARPIDQLLGTNLDDWLQREQQKAVDNIKGWAPDPRTTGVVGQAVHGLFNVIPEALPGPEVAAALQGYKSFRGGQAEGLDPTTALGKGAIDAVSTWAGLKLPMQALPRYGVAGAVATGVTGNVGLGMASRGATADWLRANGYKDMADQYKVLDNSAIAMDVIMGGGFGALAHYGPAAVEQFQAGRKRDQIQPSDVDTALTINNQLHVELDTAPGIPADPVAREAHMQAVRAALEAMARDEAVVAPPDVTNADFVDNPTAVRTREQVVEAVDDYLGPEWRALKAELEARGLPTDEIDMSGPMRVAPAREPPAGLAAADLQRMPEAGREQLRTLYEAATERKPSFDRAMQEIADALGGTFKAAPIKSSRRAVDKILADYKGDASRIKDLVRGSIIVNDAASAAAVVEQLRARFQVEPQGFRNLFDPEARPNDGYRDAKMNVVIDGLPAEIQVHVPEMIAAKSEVHDLYEARTKIERETEGRQRTEQEQARIDALNAEMRSAYDAAWASSTSRLNSASDTGAPFLRADSAENVRGGSSSQAAQDGLTPGTLPSETGMPSTSKNSTEGGKTGNFIDFTSEGSIPDLATVGKNATGDAEITVILRDRPTMRVPNEAGDVVPASVELARADAEIASAERDSQGFAAAAACALRG